MFDQEIFESEFEAEDKDLRPTHCDLLNDDQYIGQFLSMDDVCIEIPEMEDQPILEEMPLAFEELPMVKEEPMIVEKNSKKRSTFHNFQKHLVTTIRSVVNPSKLGQNPETRPCEQKMWKVFMNSTKINR